MTATNDYHQSKASLLQDSSSNMTVPDDYGECDVSLQSYNKEMTPRDNDFSVGGSRPASSLSRGDANDLLLQRLRQFGPSSGDRLRVSPTGMYSFETSSTQGGGHKMDLSIREDCKAVIISTVVHKINHRSVLSGGEKNRRHPSSQGSYSLMTKMMKYNSILSRARTSNQDKGAAAAGHICAHDGIFVYFTSVDISALTTSRTRRTLESELENVMIQAVEMTTEFSRCDGDEKTKLQKLKRLRFLKGAYNRTGCL